MIAVAQLLIAFWATEIVVVALAAAILSIRALVRRRTVA